MKIWAAHWTFVRLPLRVHPPRGVRNEAGLLHEGNTMGVAGSFTARPAH